MLKGSRWKQEIRLKNACWWKESFWGDGNVLILGCSDGYTAPYIYPKNSLNGTLKTGEFYGM